MLRELALHILDLAENSLTAGASLVTIEAIEDTRTDRLTIRVTDNGRGMDADLAARVADPFVTTRRTRRVGLGLPFLKQAAELCNGSLMIDSVQNIGTTITTTFQHSHIDRMPLGDLPGTILTLVVGYPQADFVYRHIVNDDTFEFDSRPIKAELGEVALSEPEVIGYLKKVLGGNCHSERSEGSRY
jgi:anti-sigma regulatory factor (Ser/Thr protein kinase)